MSGPTAQAPESTNEQKGDYEQDRHEHLHDVKVQGIPCNKQRGEEPREAKKNAKDQTHDFLIGARRSLKPTTLTPLAALAS